MKLKFLNIKSESTSKTKASIHLGGNLGFSETAASLMELTNEKYLQIAINEDDKKDLNLYVMVLAGKEENSIKVNKAGKYFYIKGKNIFDELEIDYKNKRVVFDIIKTDYQGKIFYKFCRREWDRKKLKK